jgi:hypothetical protein
MGMPYIYCVKFQVRLTEEEYCLFNKGDNVLQINNAYIDNTVVSFDKYDKTLATIIGTVDGNLCIRLNAVAPAKEREIHKFYINELDSNVGSLGVINKCHKYEIVNSRISTCNKLVLKFPLTYDIRSLIPKYSKEIDTVNVKLVTDKCSEGYDAVMSINNCYVCLEVDVSENMDELVKARNIKVIKDCKCNDSILACFNICVLKTVRGLESNPDTTFYGVKMSVCNYCYKFESL